jgi:hypothetical protein
MRIRTLIATVAAAFALAPLAASPALADTGDGQGQTPPACTAPLTCPDSGNWPK